MYRKFVEIWAAGFKLSMRTDGQTDGDMLIAILCTPSGGEVKRLTSLCCMTVILFEKTQHLSESSSQRLYAIMSFSYVGAMLCSNYALQFISYPAQVLLGSRSDRPTALGLGLG